jgi:hypothetical protein
MASNFMNIKSVTFELFMNIQPAILKLFMNIHPATFELFTNIQEAILSYLWQNVKSDRWQHNLGWKPQIKFQEQSPGWAQTM